MVIVPSVLCVRCVHHRQVQSEQGGDYCLRPVMLESPDYVRGTTVRPLAVLCRIERACLAPACGREGRHWEEAPVPAPVRG